MDFGGSRTGRDGRGPYVSDPLFPNLTEAREGDFGRSRARSVGLAQEGSCHWDDGGRVGSIYRCVRTPRTRNSTQNFIKREILGFARANIHSRRALPRKHSLLADFGIDIEQDLISSVTGKSRFAALGRTISGKDALSVNVKVNVNGIKALLLTCLARYQSDEYKENFGWIDQIKQVRDVPTNTALDALIEGAIGQAQFDKIWMAAPEIVDWLDVSGFRYRQPKRGQLHTDLDIRDFIASLQGQAVTVDAVDARLLHDDDMEQECMHLCIWVGAAIGHDDHPGYVPDLRRGERSKHYAAGVDPGGHERVDAAGAKQRLQVEVVRRTG